ncbi:MAG TPA: DUF192 domain-containing protein [Dehalococcoidia bacterium]|nr:DUF192 domain-containing protein [Dehalococcoidia bacterium]
MPRMLNASKGTVVAEELAVARSFRSRFRGLMLRKALADDAGLLIEPSASVHTAFMRFPIDVIFLDRDLNVVKVAENLRPYRLAFSKGHSCLELAAGGARRTAIEQGDMLVVDDQTGTTTIEHNFSAGVIDKRD